MYNIAYGGVRDPHIKELIDDAKNNDGEDLIAAIVPVSMRA
jgi:hypothetical protein